MTAAAAADAAIAPLAPGDAAAIARLAREIWLAHYPAIISREQIEYMLDQRYRPEQIRAQLGAPGVWWDKLLVAGAIVGYASYQLTETPGEMKLDKLYVHPAWQRRGYGAALVARAAAAARERRCGRLTLAVNKRNAGAIAAYRKYGFAVVGAVAQDIGGGFVMDDYLMALEL